LPRLLGLSFVMAVAMGVSALALLRHDEAQTRLRELRAQAPVESVSVTRAVDRSHRPDFSRSLPRVAGESAVMAELHRSSRESGIQLGSVSISSTSAGDRDLGKVSLSASLEGRYSDIKSVVGDVLGRYPHVTMNHMQLSRKNPGNQLTAQLVLSIWAAPQSTDDRPGVQGGGVD
jgi:Tfp pilus assembly protein PilO